MTYLRLLLVSAFIAVCTGCASPAQVANMTVPADQARANTYSTDLHQRVQVAEVNGGNKTNPMWTSDVDGPDFAAALKQSLTNAQLLGGASAPYSLRANLLRVEKPVFGFSFTVTSEVEYTLLQTTTNQVLWREIVRAPFTAGVSDAFAGIKRLRLANEGSVRTNISTLLKRLSELKIEAKQVSVEGQ
ncbi:hypothetical protein [Pseudomonas sp.]|uniref:hypothetical protein n=1 Tax=Pseudomonas sp. TaxID=306 RepID=UPI0028AB6220|nr:hypothetical protein [Pseudomonas sp.]